MTDKTSSLYNHRSTAHDFLLAKTDTTRMPTESGHGEGLKETEAISGELLKAFPNLLTGRKFMEHALGALETVDIFSACAIRIGSADPLPEDGGQAMVIAVAGAIDAACQKENGIWGMVDIDLFGCFFPEKPETFCETAATLIRSGLSGENRPAVTIGTAVYPFSTFSKDRIFENACKAVDHACFFGPDSTVAFDDVSLNISGDKIFQSGDIHGAIEEYKAGLKINDRSLNLRNSLGVCYALLDRLDLAKQEFAAATCCDGGEYMSLYNLGLIHMLLEDRAKALDYFQKALKIRDDVFEVTYQIGRLHLEMGDAETALPYLNKSLELYPTSAQAFRSLGDYHLGRDELDKAVVSYKKAIKLNPNDAAALSALGSVYDMRDENTEIATLYCEKSIQLSPKEGLFYLRLARLYQKEEREAEAREAFMAAAELGHPAPELLEEEERSQKAG
jgi:tetratricopeptide (TPR) repeat protein